MNGENSTGDDIEEAVVVPASSTGVESTRGEDVTGNEEGKDVGQAGGEDEVVAHTAPRKSYRPSLEVVKVVLQSFYAKSEFKQDLQVGGV